MIIGKVISNVWSTRKDESLVGLKFMIVESLEKPERSERTFLVAADLVGAGIGETVIITLGSSARRMKGLDNTPVDAIIVGIVDTHEQEPEVVMLERRSG